MKQVLGKRRVGVLSTLVATVMFFAFASPATAAGFGLGVEPELPSQQRDGTSAYFDVLAQPGGHVALKVHLANQTSKSMKVNAEVVPAQTGDSGNVTYQEGILKPSLLVNNIADYVTNAHETLTIPAKSTVTYSTTLTMPAQAFEGLMAGGITFEQVDEQSAEGSSSDSVGMGITSKYRYVVAVLARNQAALPLPSLSVGGASVRQVNYKNQVAFLMKNTTPTYLNMLEVKAAATLKGSNDTQYTRTSSSMQMAPNSSFYYSVTLPDNVKAGTYDVSMTAYYVNDANGKYEGANGEKYRFKKTYNGTVVVIAKKSDELTKKINTIRDTNTGISWIVWLAIGIFLLLLVLLTIAYLFYRRKKQETERLKQQIAALSEQNGAGVVAGVSGRTRAGTHAAARSHAHARTASSTNGVAGAPDSLVADEESIVTIEPAVSDVTGEFLAVAKRTPGSGEAAAAAADTASAARVSRIEHASHRADAAMKTRSSLRRDTSGRPHKVRKAKGVRGSHVMGKAGSLGNGTDTTAGPASTSASAAASTPASANDAFSIEQTSYNKDEGK